MLVPMATHTVHTYELHMLVHTFYICTYVHTMTTYVHMYVQLVLGNILINW